jgi:stage II sporulation protein AA (anti-sigma F factor antagonist)
VDAAGESGSHRLAQQSSWPRSDVVVVELDGELDLATAPQVTGYLRGLTAGGGRHLVLDVTAVTFMSSHGVSMILTALAEAGTLDRVHLVGVA